MLGHSMGPWALCAAWSVMIATAVCQGASRSLINVKNKYPYRNNSNFINGDDLYLNDISRSEDRLVHVLVFVNSDDCGLNGTHENSTLLRDLFYAWMKENGIRSTWKVQFLQNHAACGDGAGSPHELSAILEVMSSPSTAPLVTGHVGGGDAANTCDVIAALSKAWGRTVLSWDCPELEIGAGGMLPSLDEIATTVAGLAEALQWSAVNIVTIGDGWWPRLAAKLQTVLKNATVTLGVTALPDYDAEQENGNHVIIICAPFRSMHGQNFLRSINKLNLFKSTILVVDLTSIVPYLPTPLNTVLDQVLSTLSKNIHLNKSIVVSSKNTLNIFETLNVTSSGISNSTLARSKYEVTNKKYNLNSNLYESTKYNLLVLTFADANENVMECFKNKLKSVNNRHELFENIMKAVKILDNKNTNRQFKFVVLDWRDDVSIKWRPILDLKLNKHLNNTSLNQDSFAQNSTNLIQNITNVAQILIKIRNQSVIITKYNPHYAEWEERVTFRSDSCGSFCLEATLARSVSHGLFAALGALIVALVATVSVVMIRNYLLKKRLSKGPNRIVLTATDFVFPQVADARRVDEGIEAMLCCWLQQLQEFGGPEVGVGVGVGVDKPDLLKGSVGSLRALGALAGPPPPATQRNTSSSGSLSKNNCVLDLRARYNGDLVQMKQLPSGTSQELRAKAMDFLVIAHGLRHENINPLIGWLADPSQPSLVFEWCSRGSLQDVLVMDEIKLDWSFRLSLLTDLVRGMRYLHSSPLRAHGALTSRNCVIDARWVLKLTDYGLPTFYEAQGVPVPPKTAKDLLWAAPELVRAQCNGKPGSGSRVAATQPGDVYSFGIIMQEVVVRGEPYCMLSLSPEEIVEKIKRPPPLIRPSVSKGAAPPEAINIMRQCWAELPEMRPDFVAVYDLFKKLNHGRKVNFVDTMFQMLEKYSNNLEDLIRERTEQLDIEKKKTEQLLNRMLPISVADKLKLGLTVEPEEFAEVTIYFSDIVGFTSIAAHCSPVQVVDLLNDLYTCFDATINAYNVYKVETIGDAYMVVSGLPNRTRDHAEQIASMALDLLHQSGTFQIRHLPNTPLRLRIGLHSGPCCAGVVGLTMPRYCLFGDTVNTASRMESTGAPWRVHLSQTTRDRLEEAGGYLLEARGSTEVKGKGVMTTHWLLGKLGFDKPLPTPPPLGEIQGVEEIVIIPEPESTVVEMVQKEYPKRTLECASDPGTPSKGFYDKPHFLIDKSLFQVERHSEDKPNSTDLYFLTKQHELYRNSTVSIENETKQLVLDSAPSRSKQICSAKTQDTPAPDGAKGSANDSHNVIAAISNLELSATTLAERNRFLKFKKVGIIDENDLSIPYNQYRCLSPSENNLNQSLKADRPRYLKRQYSLDRTDDTEHQRETKLATPKLHKQNSAGAAPDLEKIEELPMLSPICATPKSSVSMSMDTLAQR